MKMLDLHSDVAAFLAKPQGLRIGGDRIETAAHLDVFDPSFDRVVGQVAQGTAQDIDHAVDSARAALSGPWGAMTAMIAANFCGNWPTLLKKTNRFLAS